MSRIVSFWRRLRRSALAHRRGLAALLAGVAVLLVVRALTTPAAPTRELLVASHDLPSGTVLAADDLRLVPFTLGSVPPGAVAPEVPPIGRVLAGPLGAGEVLTHVRLVGNDLLGGYPGRSITPVHISDPNTLSLLHVGTHVDLVGSDPSTGRTQMLASAAEVVAIPAPTTTTPGAGGLLLVAVAPDDATRIAAASVSAYISWVID